MEAEVITQTKSSLRNGRDDGVTLIAGLHFLVGGILLLTTCALSIPTAITGIVGIVEETDALIATFILGIIATVVLLLSILYLTVGFGLWKERSWGRIAAIALSVIGLFFVPIGTVVGGVVIWYLLKEDVSERFE